MEVEKISMQQLTKFVSSAVRGYVFLLDLFLLNKYRSLTNLPLWYSVGTKIIFWDLKGPFIDNLYKPNVSQSRLETIIEPLDLVSFLSVSFFFSVIDPTCTV